MMHLFLEPIDVWLFRDGRPFDALSDHRAESVYPPYPSVIQGAIRSHHLVIKGIDLRNPSQIASEVGTALNYEKLRLRGPFLARREQGRGVRYIPAPAHAQPDKDGYIALSPQKPPGTVRTGTPTPQMLLPIAEPQKAQLGQWLSESDLRAFLSSSPPQPTKGVPERCLFQREVRPGIGRDSQKRTTLEGALYEVEFVRPCKDVGLLVEIEGYDGWPESGLMRIGGEGHGAYFTKLDAEPWPAPPDPLPAHFLLYLATPTYFTDGWKPDRWERFFDGSVGLVAAALNRFQSLGGFDWAANNHKPARRYVPAGAVYFFEAHGAARVKPGLVQNAITDLGAEIGFGQIIVGEW
jgi:CRISPR-associated protein Cmr3